MAYVKNYDPWIDGAACCTSAPGAQVWNAAAANHIEQGIFDAAADADQALLDAAAASSAATQLDEKFAGAKPLGILHAGLAGSMFGPVRIAFLGSSSTNGTGATSSAYRYVNRFTSAVQRAYPALALADPYVVRSATKAWGTLDNTAGIHGYNGGVTGATSATYLSDAEAQLVADLNPVLVIHMIGGNDWATNVNPATYQANVQGRVDKIKQLCTRQPVQVLVHAFMQQGNQVYAREQYGAALKTVAASDPERFIFIDLLRLYGQLGIFDATDPYGVQFSDNTHPNDAGHAMTAELLLRALGLDNVVLPPQVLTTARFTSDSFNTADIADVVGRASDALLGGVTKTWQTAGGVNQIAIVGNTLQRGAATPASAFACLPEPPTSNVRVSLKIATLPTGDSVYVNLHRVGVDTTGNSYRLLLKTTGLISVEKRVSGVVTTFATDFAQYAAGDNFSFQYYRGAVSVWQNGVRIFSVFDNTIPAAGFAGVSLGASNTAFSVDDFAIDVLT